MPAKTPYSIESAKARAKLAPRNHSYWHKISPGRYLGYRIAKAGAEGTWTARLQVGRSEETQPLGTLADVEEGQRFKVAHGKALTFFDELETKGAGVQVIPSKITLRQVLREYVADRLAKKGASTSEPARRMLDALVVPYADEDGNEWIDRPLSKIKRIEFAHWRTWLTTLPTETGTVRSGATVNRSIVPFRSALNMAHRLHGIDNVWKDELARDLKADKAREADDEGGVFLELHQRAAFLEALKEEGPALLPIATLMCIAPIRPHALAAARVADYNVKTHSLFIRKDKAGAGRRVPMPPEAQKVLAQASKGKTPLAFLFPSPTGVEFLSHSWNRTVKRAVARAELPADMTLYWLRHSRITDLVDKGVSAIQIAKTAGTSVAIIEKHYFQQRDEAVRGALAVAGF